jgi:hypothetical protein
LFDGYAHWWLVELGYLAVWPSLPSCYKRVGQLYQQTTDRTKEELNTKTRR